MRSFDGVRIAVEYDFVGAYRVYVLENRGDRVMVMQPSEKWGFDWVEVPEVASDVDRPEPTWTIPSHLATPLVEELTEHGHRSDRDAKLVGTLEATRDHLEDMRQMLGLTKGASE